MPSLLSRLVPAYLLLTRAQRIYRDAGRARQHVEARRLRPRSYAPPRLLRPEVALSVEHNHGWPVYRLTPRSGGGTGGLIYFHGGGWVNEIALQHWQLAAQIAAQSQTTVTVAIYPLLPHGTADPVVSMAAALVVDSTRRYGSTCLAGDSAGGQIALSAALALRDDHQLTVPRTILIAPALDLSLTNPDIARVESSDPWLGREGLGVFIDLWRGELPLDDPRVSPLAADLAGLGPLTVFSGTRDILNPDTRRLVAKASAAGVTVDYHEATGLVHAYPLTPTPEGRSARAVIVEQVRAATRR